MKKPSISLVHVLIAKSIIETLFVSTLVVVYFLDVFPHFHGWGEVTPQAISGWAVNSRNPAERVEVQLFVDDKFVARTVASQSRPQVVAGGWATDELHGFTIPVSAMELGNHEGRVYAIHNNGRGARKTLQLLGHVFHFQVASDGTLKSLDPPSEPSRAVTQEKEY
ncbi:MAG: hypothetical protein M3R52_06605 [Acidobacteriota bacterium]|nr:hypothetical protein [Acidobacteriota bacterium]